MAKADGTNPIKAGGRAPSYNGKLMIDVVRGQVRVRAWPKPRGKNRPEIQQWWSEWLRQAMALMKFAPPGEIELWRQAVKGTPVKLSDIYLASMRGTLWAIQTSDGYTLWPEQGIEKVASSLDLITQLPGGMLVRDDATWAGIAPPDSEHMVLIGYASSMPEWLTFTEAGIPDEPVGATASRSTFQAIPRVTFTAAIFDAADQHPINNGTWEAGTPTRLNAMKSGWHSMSSYVRWSAVANCIYSYRIIKNGTDTLVSASGEIGQPNNDNAHMPLAWSGWLTFDDYIEVEVWQNAAGTEHLSVATATLVSL